MNPTAWMLLALPLVALGYTVSAIAAPKSLIAQGVVFLLWLIIGSRIGLYFS